MVSVPYNPVGARIARLLLEFNSTKNRKMLLIFIRFYIYMRSFELTRNARPYWFAIFVCFDLYFSPHQTVCFLTSPPHMAVFLSNSQ